MNPSKCLECGSLEVEVIHHENYEVKLGGVVFRVGPEDIPTCKNCGFTEITGHQLARWRAVLNEGKERRE